MCDHHDKPKLFCLGEGCNINQVYGCTNCILSYHKQGRSITEKELIQTLKKYNLPNLMKQSRKQIVLKLYNYLNMLKSEFYDNIDIYLNNILSQIKYSYLFHEEILEVYRLLRDQKYHKINHKQLQLYYKKNSKYNKQQIENQQQKIYNQYLKQLNLDLDQLQHKINKIQELFSFKISKNCHSLKQKLLNSLQIKSPRSKKSNQSPRQSPRRNKTIEDFDKPYLNNKSTLFLTPVKNTNQILDNSIQRPKSPSFTLFDDKSKDNNQNVTATTNSQNINSNKLEIVNREKSSSINENIQNKKNHQRKSFFPSQNKDVKISEYKNQKRQSFQYLYQNANNANMLIKVHIEDKLIKQKQANSNVKTNDKVQNSDRLESYPSKGSSLQSLKSNAISIQNNKINNIKGQTINSALKAQMSNPKPQKNIIQERQQSVKNRLNNLLQSQHNRIDQTIRKISEHNKALQQSQKKKTLQSLEMPFDTKRVKQANIQKKMDNSKNENYLTINDKLKQSIKAPSRFMERKDNERLKTQQVDSLAKQIFQYSRQPKPQLHNKSILQQIPHQQTKIKSIGNDQESQNIGRKPLEKIREEQLQQSAIFASGINQPNIQNKICFLQRYLKTYKNNLTAIQYLSFLYLEVNNFKQCLNLTSQQLDRINFKILENKYKFNLIINKTAALNNLGRYSETIKVLQSFKLSENEKIHKNLADAYFNIGTYDKSIYHYQKAVNLNPKLDQAFYNLAVVLFIQSNFEYAKVNINKSLYLNPKNVIYRQLSQHIQQKVMNNLKNQ